MTSAFRAAFIIHAPEYDFVSVGFARQLQGRHIDLPISFGLVSKHAINSAGQLCKGAVTVRDVRFADADQVPALILHKAQDVVLGRVNALTTAS